MACNLSFSFEYGLPRFGELTSNASSGVLRGYSGIVSTGYSPGFGLTPVRHPGGVCISAPRSVRRVKAAGRQTFQGRCVCGVEVFDSHRMTCLFLPGVAPDADRALHVLQREETGSPVRTPADSLHVLHLSGQGSLST